MDTRSDLSKTDGRAILNIDNNILQLADLYDTFFVDVFGVLFDGISLYENTLETLEKLKKMGKNIVILSNTTQIVSDAKFGYSQRGLMEGIHYDEAVTSGGFLQYTVTHNFKDFTGLMGTNIRSFKCMFMGNGNVFDGSPIKRADNYDEADFIYVGIPRSSTGAVRVDDLMENGQPLNIEDIVSKNWSQLKNSDGHQGLAEFALHLDLCLKSNKVLLVANPDIFSPGSIDNSGKKFPIVTQGCIAAYYEKLGGRVVYFGKPYKEIFEYAKGFVPSAKKIAMIGDTPWTDILGGNNSGINTILTMTGVSEEFLKRFDDSMTVFEKVDILLNEISPKMAKNADKIHVDHLIESFAAFRRKKSSQ